MSLTLHHPHFANIYHELLLRLADKPDFVSAPRGKEIKELLDVTLVINPMSPCFTNEHRPEDTLANYLLGETLWYFAGRNDVTYIEKYSKFWKAIANPDGTCNSAYGHLLFRMADAQNKSYDEDVRTQWEWALSTLLGDKDSRQAIMHFNRPSHQYTSNKDFVCTMYMNFLIRDDKLYSISRMRSQDVIRGLTFDVPFFALLYQNMYMLLKTQYPDLQIGSMMHSADSMHVYEEHYQLGTDMIASSFKPVLWKLSGNLVDGTSMPTKTLTELENLVKNNPDIDPVEALRTIGYDTPLEDVVSAEDIEEAKKLAQGTDPQEFLRQQQEIIDNAEPSNNDDDA